MPNSAQSRGNAYNVIYADPPWPFKTYSNKGKGRSAEAWYDCMTIEDIKAMTAVDYAASDCVLFLWVTNPILPVGLEVIATWGFTYKTLGFTWLRPRWTGLDFQLAACIGREPMSSFACSRRAASRNA